MDGDQLGRLGGEGLGLVGVVGGLGLGQQLADLGEQRLRDVAVHAAASSGRRIWPPAAGGRRGRRTRRSVRARRGRGTPRPSSRAGRARSRCAASAGGRGDFRPSSWSSRRRRRHRGAPTATRRSSPAARNVACAPSSGRSLRSPTIDRRGRAGRGSGQRRRGLAPPALDLAVGDRWTSTSRTTRPSTTTRRGEADAAPPIPERCAPQRERRRAGEGVAGEHGETLGAGDDRPVLERPAPGRHRQGGRQCRRLTPLDLLEGDDVGRRRRG